MEISFLVDAEGAGVAVDPADIFSKRQAKAAAFADPGWPGESDHRRFARVRIDLFDQLPALRAIVLDQRDRARERAAVAVEQALRQGPV